MLVGLLIFPDHALYYDRFHTRHIFHEYQARAVHHDNPDTRVAGRGSDDIRHRSKRSAWSAWHQADCKLLHDNLQTSDTQSSNI